MQRAYGCLVEGVLDHQVAVAIEELALIGAQPVL